MSGFTFTFFFLQVKHPPLDLRCGLLVTNVVERRAIPFDVCV